MSSVSAPRASRSASTDSMASVRPEPRVQPGGPPRFRQARLPGTCVPSLTSGIRLGASTWRLQSTTRRDAPESTAVASSIPESAAVTPAAYSDVPGDVAGQVAGCEAEVARGCSGDVVAGVVAHQHDSALVPVRRSTWKRRAARRHAHAWLTVTVTSMPRHAPIEPSTCPTAAARIPAPMPRPRGSGCGMPMMLFVGRSRSTRPRAGRARIHACVAPPPDKPEQPSNT